ncbi:MAG: efflux RND transporter periplasmic adaptor subunit, partial [Steroidobacteraceae bacterium]
MPDIAIEPAVLRQRQFKRRAAWAIPAAALVALLVWALARPAAGPAVRRSDLWISTVQRGALPIVVSASGAFQPIEQRWITAASPGVVEDVRVLPGDRVEPDTVLAVL